MASPQLNDGLQLRKDFDSISDELVRLADQEETTIPLDGITMSKADCNIMKIHYDSSVSKKFWEPYAGDAKLHEPLKHHPKLIAEIEDDDNGEDGGHSHKSKNVGEAFVYSLSYYAFAYSCVVGAALSNPVFLGKDSSKFNALRKSYVCTWLPLESRLLFDTPGHPHITILSIQPQQAVTKELLYTEFWILFNWAVRLCGRVKYNSDKTFPMRLVSICDRRARIVSAAFSTGFIRCIGTRSGDPQDYPMTCKIHIGDYYDFTQPDSCIPFATEMIAQPIGNQTVSKEQARIMYKDLLSKDSVPASATKDTTRIDPHRPAQRPFLSSSINKAS